MDEIIINWINEIPGYEVEPELKEYFNNVLEDLKQFLNLSKLDFILIPFARNPGFEKTLEKHKDYFSNPSEIKYLNYIEDGFALYVPNSLLKDVDLCLIVAKVFKFMRVSILHELFHKVFENDSFKGIYMPGNYSREGDNFTTYLEEFFVEFLAIDLNKMEIFENKSMVEKYLELNEITEQSLCKKSLKIYESFIVDGRNDLKTLLISLLSCYSIFFSCVRVIKGKIPELEVVFEKLWSKISDLKELEFFKKPMTDMMKIFINENLTEITDKMQILFNQL